MFIISSLKKSYIYLGKGWNGGRVYQDHLKLGGLILCETRGRILLVFWRRKAQKENRKEDGDRILE